MSESIFLKTKQFIQVAIGVDMLQGLSESMFWLSENWTEYTNTVNLSNIPKYELPPTFFINEETTLCEDEEWIIPAWGSRSTKTLSHSGKTFKSTQNSNTGFIANVMSNEEGKLPKPVELIGFSPEKLSIKTFAIAGNMKDFTLVFYSSPEDWLLNNPLEVFENPKRDNQGKWDLEREVQFKVVSITINTLNVSKKMARITLARPANFYEISGNELLEFNFDQEVKGEGIAVGIADKTCNFYFVDTQNTFDNYNPKSPFYQIDLRNFLLTPRIDYFSNGKFTKLLASYSLGIFYGDSMEASGKDKTARMKGITYLSRLKKLKTHRHYYIHSNLSQVIRDLFQDVQTSVSVDENLDGEVIDYQFFGGETLESTLNDLCEKFRLIISETSHSEILIRKVQSAAIVNPAAFFNLSNEFKYATSQVDKIINKVKVIQTKNSLSDKELEKYWLKGLLPSLDKWGNITLKRINIDKDGKFQEVDVLENPQNLLELPKLLISENIKKRVYSARNPLLGRPVPTLEYKVIIKSTFDSTKETYISDIVLSKDSKSESQPSYLEFEWWSEECIFESVESSLITIQIWAYAEACYEFIEYKRTYGENLEYDKNGYAIILKANNYPNGKEGQSLFYGEAQIVPPLENRGKLLHTENVVLKSSKGRIKQITEETKRKADIIEYKATEGQVWDKISSDFIKPKDSESWLWVEETFSADSLKIRYLNLSSTPKSYDIRVYGREFVKFDIASDIYENDASQMIYGIREGEVENLAHSQVKKYLKLHSKPWKSSSLEVQGNPILSVGDVVQYTNDYNLYERGQVIKNRFKIDSKGDTSSQLTTITLPSNVKNPLGEGSLGTIGEMYLG